MSKLIPLYEYEGRPNVSMGFPCGQNRLAAPTWSYALEQIRPHRIIELGSGNGGFSTILALIGQQIGFQVHTWDVTVSPDESWEELSYFLRVNFYNANVFESPAVLSHLLSGFGTSVVLCDGGNKPKEFATFAPILKRGDIIAAHDYQVPIEGNPVPHPYWGWSEITMDDVKETVEQCGLEPFMQEHFDMAGWLVFRKK